MNPAPATRSGQVSYVSRVAHLVGRKRVTRTVSVSVQLIEEKRFDLNAPLAELEAEMIRLIGPEKAELLLGKKTVDDLVQERVVLKEKDSMFS